jgi:succinyl-CoA synthetase beta subunit
VAAAGLIAGSAAGPALEAAGLDAAPVVDALVRIAQIAADHETVTVLDVNPLMVSAAGCFVADVEVRVASAAEPSPLRRID